METAMVKQIFHLQPMERLWQSRYRYCSLGITPCAEQVDTSWRKRQPVQIPCWSREEVWVGRGGRDLLLWAWMTAPLFLYCSGWGGDKKIDNEIKPGKKEGVEKKGDFGFAFVSHHLTLFLIWNKCNKFSVLPVMPLAKKSPCLYLNP